MKEVTIKIPENKFTFFIELFSQLGLKVTEEYEIPEAHKNIVRNRIKTAKPENMIPWEEAKKQLRKKAK